MKGKEELSVLKEEVENVRKKLAELTADELAQVCGSAEGDVKAYTYKGIGRIEPETGGRDDFVHRKNLH